MQESQNGIEAANFCKVLHIVEQVAIDNLVSILDHLEDSFSGVFAPFVGLFAPILKVEVGEIADDLAVRVLHYAFILLLNSCLNLRWGDLVGIVADIVFDIAPFCTEKSAQAIRNFKDHAHNCTLRVYKEKLGKLS